MEELTADRTIALHHKHWGWMVDHPSMSKEECPPEVTEGIDVNDCYNYCFVCEYCEHHSGFCGSNCLLVWGQEDPGYGTGCLSAADSPYKAWEKAYNRGQYDKCKIYAAAIRDLPVRERG